LQDNRCENKPFYQDVSTPNLNNVNSMQTEFVCSNSWVVSMPPTMLQTTSMLVNNSYDPIDSIDFNNYSETSYAMNASKPGAHLTLVQKFIICLM
jgi:hypothetical protein